MNGRIKTYLPQKGYGFIHGDDGKDYFFHRNSLRIKDQAEKLCEDVLVEFDQKAGPKGYRAELIALLNPSSIATYLLPEEVMIVRSKAINGWDIIELGNWIVHGSSRDSPDAARNDLMAKIKRLGANAGLGLEYYKTTGSEAGTGRGTHHFTIHNYRARVATVAKRSAKGKRRAEELFGINTRAEALKEELRRKTRLSKEKSISKWITLGSCVLLAFVAMGIDGIFVAVLLALVGSFFWRFNDYDAWLEPI